MKIEVLITKEILERAKMCGRSCDVVGQSCAVGLAIFDLFGDKSYVDTEEITVFSRGYGILPSSKIPLPPNVTIFISKFDQSSPAERAAMDEFSFIIDVPDDVIDLIRIDQVEEILKYSSTLRLAV